jgi:hypothetical protein
MHQGGAVIHSLRLCRQDQAGVVREPEQELKP